MSLNSEDLNSTFDESKSYLVKGNVLNILYGALKAAKVIAGNGIDIRESANGTTVSLSVVSQLRPAFSIQVLYFSSTQAFIRITKGATITNTQTGNQISVAGTGIGFDRLIEQTDMVWIDVSISDNSPTSAEVASGSEWDGYPAPFQLDGDGNQTHAYISLGRFLVVDEIPIVEDAHAGNISLVRGLIGEAGQETLGWILV